MNEESLEEWARRRAERRARITGRLRAVPLTEGPHRAGHIDPGAPRAIEEFDGTQWVTVSIAVDLAAAKAALYPPQPDAERPDRWDRPAMEQGKGRHRRTAPSEDRDH